ncbi:hypothetical protein [Streptomyces sp. NPDC091217]|uniref:hypothetical protein n=1 Tax=Streptomyces sp. NPDC091217 TaxID=3365975 RepID=UPI0037FA685F
MVGLFTATRRPYALPLAVVTVLLATAGCSTTSSGTSGADSSQAKATAIPSKDGPGVTDRTITLSYGGWLADLPAQQRAVTKSAVDEVVKIFNSRGGAGGRQIRFLPAEKDPGAPLVKQRAVAYSKANNLPLPDPSKGKQACDAYAKTPVFGLVDADLVSPPYGTAAAGACLSAGGRISVGVVGWNEADFRAAPSAAGLTLATDRAIDALVAAGKDSGVLGTGAKTGLLTDSTAPEDSSTYLPALAKAGLKNPLALPVNPNLGQADALNVVVKMKSAGLKNLVVLVGERESGKTLMALASVFKQQKYYPRILMVDGPAPDVLAYTAHGLPAQLMSNFAAYTTTVTTAPTPQILTAMKSTPAGKLCADAAAALKLSAATFMGMDHLCDNLELLKAALAASGSKYINSQAFATGLGKLSTTYRSPDLIGTEFGPDRHYGASGLARVDYSAKCKCSVVSNHRIPF